MHPSLAPTRRAGVDLDVLHHFGAAGLLDTDGSGHVRSANRVRPSIVTPVRSDSWNPRIGTRQMVMSDILDVTMPMSAPDYATPGLPKIEALPVLANRWLIIAMMGTVMLLVFTYAVTCCLFDHSPV